MPWKRHINEFRYFEMYILVVFGPLPCEPGGTGNLPDLGALAANFWRPGGTSSEVRATWRYFQQPAWDPRTSDDLGLATLEVFPANFWQTSDLQGRLNSLG